MSLLAKRKAEALFQHGRSPIYQLAKAVGTRREALCPIDPDPSGLEFGCSGTEGRLHRRKSVSPGAENMTTKPKKSKVSNKKSKTWYVEKYMRIA